MSRRTLGIRDHKEKRAKLYSLGNPESPIAVRSLSWRRRGRTRGPCGRGDSGRHVAGNLGHVACGAGGRQSHAAAGRDKRSNNNDK
eukprot:456391-Prymnesium_polylepis.2